MLPHPPPRDGTGLDDCFGFTLDELALNRAGQFSARQRQTLTYRSIGALVRGVGLVTLAIVLAASLAPTVRRPADRALFGLLLGAIALLAGLLLRAAWIVHHPAVQHASGPLRRAGNARHPAICVGTVTLRVAYRRWKRLADTYPGRYRVYFDPAGNLLSLERLDD